MTSTTNRTQGLIAVSRSLTASFGATAFGTERGNGLLLELNDQRNWDQLDPGYVDDVCVDKECACQSEWMEDLVSALGADQSPEWSESIARLKRLCSSNNADISAVAKATLGRVYETLSQPEEAVRWYRKAAKAGHTEVTPLGMMGLAMAYRSLGRLDKTAHWLDKTAKTGHPYLANEAIELQALIRESSDPV